MQIKKDEVRLAILEQAEKEFLQKGFEAASLRNIAKAAGTTIGNFYNYFGSKETLFDELVKDEYQNFIYFIENHEEAGREEFQWDKLDARQLRSALEALIQKVMPLFTDHFLLLVEGSQGTKYAHAREKLLCVLEEHFVQHIAEFSPDKVSKAMGSIIAHQVLNGILMILKHHKDEQTRKELLAEHLVYHIMGIAGLLGI